MILFPKLFNHGTLRNIKVGQGKVTFEGTNGKAEFVDTGSTLPEEGTAGQVLTKFGDDPDQMYWADVNQVPSNGSIGNFLVKYGEEPDDYAWATTYTVPPEGTTGQVLTKQSSTDGDYEWATPAGGSVPTLTVDINYGDLSGPMPFSYRGLTQDFSEFDGSVDGPYDIHFQMIQGYGVNYIVSDPWVRVTFFYNQNAHKKTAFIPLLLLSSNNDAILVNVEITFTENTTTHKWNNTTTATLLKVLTP